MLALEHCNSSDFYTSVWRSRSPVPLLIIRTLLFLSSIAIVISSVIIYWLNHKLNYWLIYLTHWGLLFIVLTTGFSVWISARYCMYESIRGPILPWYVKTYWILYNISIPFAFFITVFYWTILHKDNKDGEWGQGLDVAVHGLNSLVVFVLLVTSSQPSRLAHVYQPLIFGLIFVFFSALYYLTGGVDKKGDPWIYPVLNWANPGATLVTILLTTLQLTFFHSLTVGLATARDVISRRLVLRSSDIMQVDGAPLTTVTSA